MEDHAALYIDRADSVVSVHDAGREPTGGPPAGRPMRSACLLLCALLLAACGDDDGPTGPVIDSYPLEVGNRWDYRLTVRDRLLMGEGEGDHVLEYSATLVWQIAAHACRPVSYVSDAQKAWMRWQASFSAVSEVA